MEDKKMKGNCMFNPPVIINTGRLDAVYGFEMMARWDVPNNTKSWFWMGG